MPPWEKYQQKAPEGPWTQFAPPESRSLLQRIHDYTSGVTDQLTAGAVPGVDEFAALSTAAGQSVFGWKDKEGRPNTPGNTFGERYDAALAQERTGRRRFADENPVVSMGANILGGVGGAPAAMGAGVARLTADLPKIVQYAAAGAVPGAVYGFGEGEGGPENRLQAAGAGATLGGLIGLGTGYAGEGIARLLRRGTAAGTPPMVTPDGLLTAEGRQALQQAGIDPDAIAQGFGQEFARRAQEAVRAGRPVDPVQLARVMQGESLPVPVPQTRGQISGSPSAQMFENLAEKGTYGPRSERFMQGIRESQQDALRRNVDAIATQIGGAPVRAEGAIPGQQAQARLAAMRGAEKAGVDAAYTAARGTNAGAPGEIVARLRGDIADRIGAEHAIDNIPKVMNVLRQLEGVGSGEGASVPINRLFFMRAQLNGVIKGGGEDGVAARAAKSIIDGHLDDIVTQGLLRGDDAAIDAWRNAIAANREFAGRFKGSDIIEKLTTMDYRSGTRQLAVPADQATNAIFGASKLFGGGNTARDLARLRDVLGPQSAEWQALRQEAVMRLFQSGQGPMHPTTGVRAFSGANFAKGFDNAMLQSPGIIRTFFTPEEIATLRQFRDVAGRVTGTVKGGDNFSNTIPGASNVVQSLLARFFTSEQAMMRFMAMPVVRSMMDYGAGASLAGRTSSQAARLPSGSEVWAAPVGGVLAPRFIERQGQ